MNTATRTEEVTASQLEVGAVAYVQKWRYVDSIVSADVMDHGRTVKVLYVGPTAARNADGTPVTTTWTEYVWVNDCKEMIEEMEAMILVSPIKEGEVYAVRLHLLDHPSVSRRFVTWAEELDDRINNLLVTCPRAVIRYL